MIDRTLLARMRAKGLLGKKENVPVAKPTVEKKESKKPKKSAKLLMVNPETGKIIKQFTGIDNAVKLGFSEPNILRSVKNGTKYKDALWKQEA